MSVVTRGSRPGGRHPASWLHQRQQGNDNRDRQFHCLATCLLDENHNLTFVGSKKIETHTTRFFLKIDDHKRISYAELNPDTRVSWGKQTRKSIYHCAMPEESFCRFCRHGESDPILYKAWFEQRNCAQGGQKVVRSIGR